MKKRYYIILAICLVLIAYFLFRPSDIKELKCYKKTNKGQVTLRVYLIDSPPITIGGMRSLVLEKIKQVKRTNSSSETLMFIKEKDKEFFNRFIWGEGDGNYSNCTTDLDNEDFLARVDFFKTNVGKDTLSLLIYSGSLYYY